MVVVEKFDFYLIRGLVRETGHWGPFLDELKKQEYVQSVKGIDLPGNGQFHRLKSALSVGEMADFVHSHVDTASERPRVLLAVSLGAMVAIEILNRYSSCYKSAFLMNTSVSGVSPFYQRLKMQSLKHFYEILIAPSLEEREMNILEMVSNSSSKRNAIHQLWVNLAEKKPVTHANFLRQLLAATYYRLPKTKPECPIYLMTSDADRMVDFHCSQKLAKKWVLPIAVHDEAGHELSLDAPEWVLEQMRNWLKQS